MARSKLRTLVVGLLVAAAPIAALRAQGAHVHDMADHAMGGPMDANMMKHMELTPVRVPSHADSVKARQVANELRQAISRYRDTSAAVAAGFRMFLPNVKEQRVYHFTRAMNGVKSVFRFDPTQPTSLIYTRAPDGSLNLLGGMYTLPQRAKLDRLNDRVPLGIARWHKHVNWCLPATDAAARFAEKLPDGSPKFGPASPIDTEAACKAAGGEFHPTLFGWMVHVNVFAGDDLGAIFADEHGR